METVQFTEGVVLTELLRLNESKSPGPDEIPAKILKELADELAKPLSMLFHTSFETGYLPPDSKSAWITPLYKGGSPVHVSDQQSAEVGVKSGVPQGSVLGPTLFLVYVNDCANELDCDVAMFVENIKIWTTIRNEVDEAQLQTNLDHFEQWSKDWFLPFNVNKCNFLRVGGTSSPNRTVNRLTGKPLQEVDAQKDLGVWSTTLLKPSLQCSKVAKSAMSFLYLVKRAFSSFDEDYFAKVFQTFMPPHLEFAIQAWRHRTAKDLGILEQVQRRATELVSGQWSLPYETRLANLDLFPLSYRQLRGDQIQAFRIVRNQGCCRASGDFFELATTTNLRGHPLKLRVTGVRLDTRKFFFSNRGVAAWNALPEDVVMSGSLFDLTIERFISSWFSMLSDDPQFPSEIKLQFQHVCSAILLRLKTVDVPRLIEEKILCCVVHHVEHLLILNKGHYGLNESSGPGGLGLSFPPDDEVLHQLYSFNYLHPAMLSRQTESAYLRGVVQKLLPHLLIPPTLGLPSGARRITGTQGGQTRSLQANNLSFSDLAYASAQFYHQLPKAAPTAFNTKSMAEGSVYQQVRFSSKSCATSSRFV
ncbi:hypothetical protein SprV_0602121900 [Sparganum proliferum]